LVHGGSEVAVPHESLLHTDGYLAENWMHLRLAIEGSLKAKPDPERVPFLLVSQFWKNLGQTRTAAERVLAAKERIE
jgi:hypothetical protein